MKRLLFILVLIPMLVRAAVFDLTNDTVMVKSPGSADEATPKSYVDANTVPTGRTVTINTQTGTLSSNVTFNVADEKELIVLAGVNYANTGTGVVGLAYATNLSFTAASNSEYLVEGFISWLTSATTIGINLAVDGPAYTHVRGRTDSQLTATTVFGAGYMATRQPGGPSTAAPWTSNNLSCMTVMYGCGPTSGLVSVMFSAEVTGTVTVQSNSFLRIRKVYP